MKNRLAIAFLVVVLGMGLFPAKKKAERIELPEKYRKWILEEVVYIISPTERRVFLLLQSDRERDSFIEAFWKHRDPNTNTPDNEFKTEHYRRIDYANNWFGKDSPGAGWRSDMGRIYILLGEPKSIERFENTTELMPTVIWFFQNMATFGLPDAFNVVFFKKDHVGEYELYSPIKNGPQQLLANFTGDPTNYVQAYQQMMSIEPKVAEIALTLIPGEPLNINPSIASEMLIRSKIPNAPVVRLSSIYAEKFLKYKDIVEVDYTSNYIDSSSTISVIRDPCGIHFVHYLIEPKRLSIEQYDNRFYTQLEVYGSVIDKTTNTTVYQIKDTIPIEFTREQIEKIKDKLFCFQSMFPLVPGRYSLTILLKNTVFKEYTSLDREIEVSENPLLKISPLILANRITENPTLKTQSKPFTFDGCQYLSSPRNDFMTHDTLYLFFQILNLPDELKQNGILDFSIEKDNQKVRTLSRGIAQYPFAPNISERFSLVDLPPANYTIKVSLRSQGKIPLTTAENYFYVSPLSTLSRPWVVSRPQALATDPIYINELGNQYLNMKQNQKALLFLEKAYQSNPAMLRFALDYCTILLSHKQYQKILDIALSFSKGEKKYDFSFVLGQTHQALGNYTEALSHFRDQIMHFGTTFQVLNALGECYKQLGDREEALKAWSKSLEINARQENIRSLVNQLQGEKK